MDFLFDYGPSLFLLAALLGLCVGSFLNVVIYRLPLMLHNLWIKECISFLNENQKDSPIALPETPSQTFNLAWPHSHCPACKHPLSLLENIPVLSYVFQRGRCKHCSVRISSRYPIVELLTAFFTLVTVMHFGASWATWLALFFTWTLIALSFIDLDHQILPDDITLPILWFGLFLNAFTVFVPPHTAIVGALAGYLSFWFVYQIFKLCTGKEGMGHGDFKLMALLGAWLGWQALPLIIILSSLVGALVGIGLIVFRKHDKATPIPFGPYIALAGWIAFLWGDMILTYYFQFLGLEVR